MAKSLVFLLHGVGRQPSGWSEPVQDALAAGAVASGAVAKAADLKKHVEFVELRYDQIFVNYLERWAELADQQGIPAGHPLFAAIKKLGKNRNAFVDHAGDVLLYRLSYSIGRHVRLHLNKTIYERYVAHLERGGNAPVAFVAHSLGTAVLHDLLHNLQVDPFVSHGSRYTGANQLQSRIRAQAVFMLANTSRLLHWTEAPPTPDPPDAKCSLVHAGPASAGLVCERFYNVEHRLDPIPKPRRFRVPTGWNADNLQLGIGHVHEPNVHGFAHHVAHPRVYGHLLRAALPALFTAQHLARAEALGAEWDAQRHSPLAAEARARIEAELQPWLQRFSAATLALEDFAQSMVELKQLLDVGRP
jgi:hypothetical protein